MGKWNGLKSKTYIFHCEKCLRMIRKDEWTEECPPESDHTHFNEMLAKGELGKAFIPDYKKGENYPQRAVNLPGEPWVTSHQDYQTKCREAGQVETGLSNESKYRMRQKAMRGKRQFFDVDSRTGKTEYKGNF